MSHYNKSLNLSANIMSKNKIMNIWSSLNDAQYERKNLAFLLAIFFLIFPCTFYFNKKKIRFSCVKHRFSGAYRFAGK